MAYSLGNVKPHVAAVANAVGPRFGITTAYGYSFRNIAGTTTLSDHARGLAVDFMCNQAQGDALAEYLRENARAFDITYVIWNRRIWSLGRNAQGWRPYSGVSPHTDHVHASFADIGSGVVQAGLDLTPWDGVLPPLPPWLGGGSDGKPGIPDPLQDGAGAAWNSIKDVGAALGSLANVARFVTDKNNWIRVLLFVVGCWLVTLGLLALLRNMQVAQKAARVTAKAVKTAKVVKNAG